MREFTHNGLRLEYSVRGEGVPFVFLHGMGGSVRQIDAAYDPIPGVQMISPNQQGHANSEADWTHYDFDHLADDVDALLDELQLPQAYLAGISMGAAVGLNFAARHPERVKKLLLIRNAWTDQPMSPKVRIAYRDLGTALKQNSIEAFYRSEGWAIVAEQGAYTRNAFISTFDDPACVKNWQKYLILPGKTPISSLGALQALTMPIMILANRHDLCHPFECGVYLHESLPGSVFQEISDKDTDKDGHRADVNRAVRGMLGGNTF
ncbi:MAG TPA: alpha/beta hydrolase [Clostridia bacterium]|nr:alpha/beta hydrolase [Clostridia bacterium]